MIDNSDTDPAIIRATYQARGKNRRLNIQKAESLGVHASSISPTSGVNNSGGAGGTGATFSGSGQVIDPVLSSNPDTPTYSDSNYYRNPDSPDGFETA